MGKLLNNKPGVWRVGRKVRTNVYDEDRPVCQCHSEFDAALIVSAVNGIKFPRKKVPDESKNSNIKI